MYQFPALASASAPAVALAIKLPRSKLLLSVKPDMLIGIAAGAVELLGAADVAEGCSG